MIQKHFLTILLLSLVSLHAQSDAYFFQTQAEMGLERSMLTGHIKIGVDNNSSDINLKNDLGIKGATQGLKTMLSRSTTHHKFGFKLEKYQHSASRKLSQNILYNGSHYATSSLVKSEISLRWAKAKYRYRYTKTLSFGADLNALRFKTMLNDNEVKKTVILPAVGFDYERELEEGLGFITKASSTLASRSKYRYAYMGFAYHLPIQHCTCLHIGYQYKNLNIHRDQIAMDLKYQGLYAGLAMQF